MKIKLKNIQKWWWVWYEYGENYDGEYEYKYEYRENSDGEYEYEYEYSGNSDGEYEYESVLVLIIVPNLED